MTQATPNPTPSNEGASTLDRIQAYLSGSEPENNPAQAEQSAQPDDPEQTHSEPDDDGPAESNEPQLSTTDLAKLLKLEENALDLDEEGNAIFKTKIDGKEGTAKLQDLLKSYQLQEHVDRKAREAAEREKAIEARRQEAEQQVTQRLQYAENLVNVAAQDLLREFQSINWQGLEQQDPGQAALLRQKFQERQAQLRGVLHNVEQHKAQTHAQIAHQRAQVLAREAERLPQIIPEWKDKAVADKERGEIRGWLQDQGFTSEEIDGFALAHHVAIVRKAMLHDKLSTSRTAVEAKVRTAPKLVKPGSTSAPTQETRLQNLKTAVRKSGGKNGTVADYLIARGIVR